MYMKLHFQEALEHSGPYFNELSAWSKVHSGRVQIHFC